MKKIITVFLTLTFTMAMFAGVANAGDSIDSPGAPKYNDGFIRDVDLACQLAPECAIFLD